MGKKDGKMTKRQRSSAVIALLLFFVVILGVVVGMNIKNSNDLQTILEESVHSQLISICVAAGEIIDVDAFISYNDASAAQMPTYQNTLNQLRSLCKSVDAQYIYALKYVDGESIFVFDTDEEDEEVFIEYDLSPVHAAAFKGERAAAMMNVDDEYGSFNTGAVPIYKNGTVVGIIAADTEDSFLTRSLSAAKTNTFLLIILLAITMFVMLLLVLRLMKQLRGMQKKLEIQAHYDTVTGLPNRQYLMEYLADETIHDAAKTPFALFFIDLDNFKKVNDNAGHDAGDTVLRNIAKYLDTALANTKSFRPSAGQLNISARVGGDEFVQVVHGVNNIEQASALAQQLVDNFEIEDQDRYIQKYNVGLSIGVALYPYHSENYNVLIKYADIAMYKAKSNGKNQYFIYDDELSAEEE